MDTAVPPKDKLMPVASDQEREYLKKEVVVFRTTQGPFGGLSNMAAGFPLTVSGIRFWTAEALYQCCRFPDAADVQKLIIAERSPMTAKMKSKRFRERTRSDWEGLRVRIMKWCLRVKLVQHQRKFGELLRATDGRPIVEESLRDQFWGAKPCDDGTLRGKNVLGRLLMELREEFVRADGAIDHVDPPDISNFRILGKPIGLVSDSDLAEPASNSIPLLTADQHQQIVHILGDLPREDWVNLLHFLLSSGIVPDQASLDLELHFGHDISAPNQSTIRLLSELVQRSGLRFQLKETKP